eukprot:2503689-Ditylum_brightwellii.AAC.1
MLSYLNDSKQLKDDLIRINVPPGVKLFTANATLMYTNLKTEFVIDALGKYLTNNHGSSNNSHALLKKMH